MIAVHNRFFCRMCRNNIKKNTIMLRQIINAGTWYAYACKRSSFCLECAKNVCAKEIQNYSQIYNKMSGVNFTPNDILVKQEVPNDGRNKREENNFENIIRSVEEE